MKVSKLIKNVALIAASSACFSAFASNLHGPMINLDSCATILNETYINPWPREVDAQWRPSCGLTPYGEPYVYCERPVARMSSAFKIDLQAKTCDGMLNYQDLLTGSQYRSMHVSCKIYQNQISRISENVLIAFADTDLPLGKLGKVSFRIDGQNWIHHDAFPLTPDGYAIAIGLPRRSDASHISGSLSYGIQAAYSNGTIVPNSHYVTACE